MVDIITFFITQCKPQNIKKGKPLREIYKEEIMRGSKKFVASLLTTAALASSFAAFAATPADVEGTRYAEPIQVLSALDIMNGDGDGNYRPNDTIIRSEVTKMVIHALGLEDAASSAQGLSKFPDVPKDHWANGYINIATSQGIIIGDDEGNFRPNDKITYAEAMTILVRALGYERPAEQKGGFPQGYLVVGSDNGISKGVSSNANSDIARGDVAIMTKNALEVNLMEMTGFGQDIEYEVTDKTLLKDKLKVTKSSGQIVAIQDTSLEGDSNLSANQVKIGDTVYDTSVNLNNLLGYNVEFYVKETAQSDNTVILAVPQKEKNSTLTINAKLFEAISSKGENKVLEYYKQETDSKTSTVTLETDATLIYNGKHAEMSDELLNIKNKSGNIVVLDTDRNGKYDIVFVTEYRNLVVEEVTASEKIIDKYGAPALKLDSDDEDLRYSITKGYEELKLSDLKEYDVLSIAASKDEKLYSIVVTNSSVEGKVTGIDSEGVYIGDEHYEIAANYTQEISMGTEGVFYLDIDNRIAAADTTVQISSNYAYLIKAYADMNTDEIARFKVFTKEGSEKVFEAAEKIRLNGKSGYLATDVVKMLNNESDITTKQLITYGLNSDGKLVSLNTAIDKTATGEADENHFTKNYVLDDAKFNAKLNSLGKVKLNESTVIFDIPQDAKDSSDYSIASLSMFEDGQKYDVIVFDRTDDFYAKAIIVTNAAFQTNAESSIAVVSKVVSSTNSADEITEKLYAYQDGKEITINAESEGILVKGEDKALENGDIIQYQTNSKGEIANVRVLFDVSTKDIEKAETPVENLSVVYGKVTKKFAKSMNVTVNDGEVMNIQLPDDVVVYSLDTSKNKNNITVATTGDIQAYDEDEGNRVFVRIYKDVVQEVVIIK